MDSPVRIYIIHHPKSELARLLTGRLYDWFRTPNLEGIPVYVRSDPPERKRTKVPIDPEGRTKTLEYLVPLVDSHMVRDVAWHDYLVRLFGKCLSDDDRSTKGWVMFPVALDGTAFNLPGIITQRNYVRLMGALSAAAVDGKIPLDDPAIMVVLKDLTEAMSLDLHSRIFPGQAGRKLKIFISYARADGAAVPKAIRDYISGQTQCDAFFDENDIGFGFKYDKVLHSNAGEQAKALIVVAGDHYAERPICRWEIRKFTEPDSVPVNPARPKGRQVRVFHPMMVLSTLDGVRITRILPELGQSPILRWEAGREMSCFSILMRTVLFGARNILAARQLNEKEGIILNRLPGPISLQRLLSENRQEARGRGPRPVVHYPGNGLPLLELRLLESTFKNVRLTAFQDVDRHLPEALRVAIEAGKRPFHEKVIGISSGFSSKLGSLGYLAQHIEEALIYLLRPLLRLGADVMYGGKLPKGEAVEKGNRNMTLSLMNLVNDELSISSISGPASGKRAKFSPSRLFNPSSWPDTKKITPENEAAWINTCSVIQTSPSAVDLKGEEPEKGSPEYFAWKGLVLSHSRQMMAKGFKCPVAGNPKRMVIPEAMIFVGGRLAGFSGAMPGIMEEFYWALRHGRPVYLLGGFGGATQAIVDALGGSGKTMPDTFKTSFYEKDADYASLLEGYKRLKVRDEDRPEARLSALWKTLFEARDQDFGELCRNGLSDAENKELMTTVSTNDAVHLIWKGLAKLKFPTSVKKRATPSKSTGVSRKNTFLPKKSPRSGKS